MDLTPPPPPRNIPARVVLLTCAVLVAAGVLWVAAASLLVAGAARGRTYSDPALTPPRHVGLVLGCSRTLSGGLHNPFFDNRIQAAARLFHAGKVEYLVVSGDNHVRGYDEPQDMKNGLIEAGVPAARIYCDYAGFRTLDSIVRVREVFGQTSVTVISQEFHNRRAIFIARHRGVDAIGFNAADVDTYDNFATRCREAVARANMLLDIFVIRRAPKFLGKKVEIPAGA
jgi:SanA protein